MYVFAQGGDEEDEYGRGKGSFSRGGRPSALLPEKGEKEWSLVGRTLGAVEKELREMGREMGKLLIFLEGGGEGSEGEGSEGEGSEWSGDEMEGMTDAEFARELGFVFTARPGSKAVG